MNQRGLSMIEILVTLTIVAFALLGLLGLQARALSYQKDSFDRKAAAELVSQLAERMRANHFGAEQGQYADDFEPGDADIAAVTACAIPCNWAQVAVRDLDEWRMDLRRRIPLGASYIRWAAATREWTEVTVAWPEPQAETSAGQDLVCDQLRAGGAVLPLSYRCFRVRVFP